MNVDFEQYLGIPWSAQHNDPKRGFNCWSFVRYLYTRHKGISLPQVQFCPHDIRSCIAGIVKGREYYTKVTNPNPWSIVLMAKRREPCHVGMMINTTHMIHALEGMGVMITRLSMLEHYELKVIGVYEWQSS